MSLTYPPKFKFFNVETQKMHDVCAICLYGRPTVTVSYNPVKKYFLDSGYLLQMANLIDCKGKPIFERDVVLNKDGYIGVVEIGNYGCNEWDGWHYGFYIDWKFNKHYVNRKPTIRKDILFWVNEREIEVIGNVYENPELLKK